MERNAHVASLACKLQKATLGTLDLPQTVQCFLHVVSTRFLSSPFIIRVPFFLIFSFNKGTRK